MTGQRPEHELVLWRKINTLSRRITFDCYCSCGDVFETDAPDTGIARAKLVIHRARLADGETHE